MAQGYGIGTNQDKAAPAGPKDPIGKFVYGLFKGKEKPAPAPQAPGNGMAKQAENAIRNRQRQLEEASK